MALWLQFGECGKVPGTQATIMRFVALMRRLAGSVLARAGRKLTNAARALSEAPIKRTSRLWSKVQGDRNLRLDYDLTVSSLILDVGGYEGQWANDIYEKYSCVVHVFEPVPEYVEQIRARFVHNTKIIVHPYGLSDRNANVQIVVAGSKSSVLSEGTDRRETRLVRAADFLRELGLPEIDLMKVNIEGGEYELLEHLLDEGLVGIIRNIQVQFHDNIPDAEARMTAIQRRLSDTHRLTYQYPFVWENWQRIEPQ